MIRIGTAGWSIAKPHAADFPGEGSHLERYARRLSAVEINSCFYRPHRAATYARWAAAVPAGFRFAAKIPREITHVRRLVSVADMLDRFLSEVGALGDRLGPLLLQLPPSLRFDESIVGGFFSLFRARFDGVIVCEPRHPSWFTNGVDRLLARWLIARAAADPAPVPRATVPGGWPGLIYRRLHGSPRMYHSGYSPQYLDQTARLVTAGCHEQWCIFDNTALGEATRDALDLVQRVRSAQPSL